mgnify:CR=1 FL=1
MFLVTHHREKPVPVVTVMTIARSLTACLVLLATEQAVELEFVFERATFLFRFRFICQLLLASVRYRWTRMWT